MTAKNLEVRRNPDAFESDQNFAVKLQINESTKVAIEAANVTEYRSVISHRILTEKILMREAFSLTGFVREPRRSYLGYTYRYKSFRE